MSYLVIT